MRATPCPRSAQGLVHGLPITCSPIRCSPEPSRLWGLVLESPPWLPPLGGGLFLLPGGQDRPLQRAQTGAGQRTGGGGWASVCRGQKPGRREPRGRAQLGSGRQGCGNSADIFQVQREATQGFRPGSDNTLFFRDVVCFEGSSILAGDTASPASPSVRAHGHPSSELRTGRPQTPPHPDSPGGPPGGADVVMFPSRGGLWRGPPG